MSVAIFLPCRAGSTRVPHKNTRAFAGNSDGLLGVKLCQLADVSVDEVVVDSNDPEVLSIAEGYQKRWSGKGQLTVRERPDELGQSETTTDALIVYALDTLEHDDMLWTHVTSPLAGADVYQRALGAYVDRDPDQHDSLMSVNPLRTFLWSGSGPVNYRREDTKWPRTQDIEPLYEINSAVFVVPTALGRELADRIGRSPLLFPLSKVEALDVDWEEDFDFAEYAYRRWGTATTIVAPT